MGALELHGELWIAACNHANEGLASGLSLKPGEVGPHKPSSLRASSEGTVREGKHFSAASLSCSVLLLYPPWQRLTKPCAPPLCC